MGQAFAFALTAALNPTLLTATTVMLALERPKRLLFGYLMGAYLTSITCGLLLVFALPHSSTSSTAKKTVNPIINIVLGLLVLLVVFIVGTGRDKRRRARSARRREAKKDKPPPRWRQELSKGSARQTFVVGVLLSFPGASYIAGMDTLAHQKLSTFVTVLCVIAFNLIMMLLLELPLIGYLFAPERTDETVARFSAWLTRRGGRIGIALGTGFGFLLIIRGIVNW